MVLDTVGFVVALLVAAVPGAAVLFLLGVRRLLWYLALTAPCSVAVASVTGLVTAALGVDYGVIALGVGSALLAAGGGVRLVVSGRLRAARRVDRSASATRTWAGLVGIGTSLAGLAASVLTWLGGMGWTLRTYPQEHDMIFHLALSSYIARSGVGAPWKLGPTDVLTGADPFFYPAGLHLLVGAVTQVTGDAVVSINAMTLVLVAIGAPIGAACLTFALGRTSGFAADTSLGAAGVASVLVATLYRPGVQLAHDGGILPNSVALACAFGTLAALVSWRHVPRPVLLGAGVAVAGGAIVHPSALITFGVTVAVYVLVDALRRPRQDVHRAIRAFLPLGVVAIVIALPTLLFGSSAVAKTTSFVSATPNRPLPFAVGKALTFAYGGYLDPNSTRAQVAAALLILAGVFVLLLARRAEPWLVVVAVWFAIVVSYFVGPGKGAAGVLTGFFYNSEPRVWSHLTLVGVPAGALGVALAARWVARRVPGLGRPAVPGVTAGLLAIVLLGYLAGPGYGYARINENAVASRFATPDFSRVDGDDEAAAAWLATRVSPGERILNSANDGSTLLYTKYGLPVVNLATLGVSTEPYTYQLLASFRTYPSNPLVRAELRDLDVGWLYVDSEAPPIGVGGATDNWPQVDLLTVPRGFLDLDGLPGLEPAFAAGSVTVYRLGPAAVAP